MQLNKVTDALSVSPQITAEDVAAIRDAGFRAIICNRPDGEGADQPRAGFDQHLVGTTRAQLTQQCS